MKQESIDAEIRSDEELKAQKERTYKLITFLSMGGILMMFIGWISAVVVSKMDGFWVNLKLPTPFYTSTLMILLSSLTFAMALRSAKKDKAGMSRLMLGLTFVLGVVFVYFQFLGWKQMVANGNYFSGGMYFEKGAYGDRFVVLKDGKEIHFDGYYYSIEGDTLAPDEVNELKLFINPVCLDERKFVVRKYEMPNYGSPYTIGIKGKYDVAPDQLELKDGVFYHNGVEMTINDQSTLFAFTFGIKNDTPFFGVKGKYGEDFTVSMNGQVLDFIDRKFYFPSPEMTETQIKEVESKHYQGGKEYIIKEGNVYLDGQVAKVNDFLFTDKSSQKDIYISNGKWFYIGDEITPGQYNKFFQANNTASSYIYVLSVMHALHILLGFGLLIVLLIRSNKGYYHAGHVTGLKVGGYFWHFLGILWFGLFLFWMSITI